MPHPLDPSDPFAPEPAAAVDAPLVAAPPPFADRRVAFRRAADRVLHEENRLLARGVDVLAAGTTADARLGGLLRLLADALDAPRAALLGAVPVRRIAVVIEADEDPAAADALAAWLDSAGPRSRAQRAAAGPAPVVHLVAPRPPRRAPLPPVKRERTVADAAPTESRPSALTSRRAAASGPTRLFLALPGDGGLLGFDLVEALDAEALEQRLPDALLRDAAALLAVVSRDLARERELDTLRARETERSRFVSTVAHELRTPLTGLGGYLDLILEGKVQDPAVEREFLERSRSIVSSIAELVGDLLELSKLDAGSLRMELAPFSMAEVATRVVGALDPIAMSRGIALTSELPPRMRMALGDRRRVEQILTNLIGNALKFVPIGGTVRIAAWADGPAAIFAVRDDGAGIEREDRARIFERFQRLAVHENVIGTGLGLPIARDLARAMGGDLAVASVPGSGSTFLLGLPGPAGAATADIAAILGRLVPSEEGGLQERAILRALDAAGRSIPAIVRALPVEPAAADDQPRQALTISQVAAVDAVREVKGRRRATPKPAPTDAAPTDAPSVDGSSPTAPTPPRRPRLRALDGGAHGSSTRPFPA